MTGTDKPTSRPPSISLALLKQKAPDKSMEANSNFVGLPHPKSSSYAFENSRLLVVQLAANLVSDNGGNVYQRFIARQLLRLHESSDGREAIPEVVFRRRWIHPCPAFRRAAEELVFIVDVVCFCTNRDSSPFGSLIIVLLYAGTNSGGNDTYDVVLSARLEKNSQAFMKRKIQLASPVAWWFVTPTQIPTSGNSVTCSASTGTTAEPSGARETGGKAGTRG
nr:hypothetical protein Iba_chr09eCG3930 [Ipomoea batatas]